MVGVRTAAVSSRVTESCALVGSAQLWKNCVSSVEEEMARYLFINHARLIFTYSFDARMTNCVSSVLEEMARYSCSKPRLPVPYGSSGIRRFSPAKRCNSPCDDNA